MSLKMKSASASGGVLYMSLRHLFLRFRVIKLVLRNRLNLCILLVVKIMSQ